MVESLEEIRNWAKAQGKLSEGKLSGPTTDAPKDLSTEAAMHYLYQGQAMVIDRLDRIIEILNPSQAEEVPGRPSRLVMAEAQKELPYSFIREQYNIIERKHLVLTTAPSFFEIIHNDAAIALINTDSIIKFDVQPLTDDSTEISGSSTTFGTITLGIQRIPIPPTGHRRVYFQLISGPGNVWLLLGD